MSLTDSAVAAGLAPAGLQFVERIRGEVREPLPPHRGPASCLPEDGRFDSAPVAVDDPDLTAKVNADRWRMAVEYGLRLAGEWDVVDSRVPVLRSGFAGLFTESFVPEFTMLSLDGWVLLTTTVWGDGTVSTIVIRADRLPGEPRRAPVDRFWIFCSSR